MCKNTERSTDGTKLKLCFKQNCVLANSLLKLFGTNPLALGKVKRCPIVPGILVCVSAFGKPLATNT